MVSRVWLHTEAHTLAYAAGPSRGDLASPCRRPSLLDEGCFVANEDKRLKQWNRGFTYIAKANLFTEQGTLMLARVRSAVHCSCSKSYMSEQTTSFRESTPEEPNKST